MSLALMLALQAAAPAALPLAPIDFDLARHRPAEQGPTGRGCRADEPAPILVCGRRPSGGGYPMAEWARLFAPRPVVAQAELGGGVTTSAYVQQVGFDRGAVSNRIMVGIRLPF